MSVSRIDFSTSSRPRALAQCWVVNISQVMKPLSSMNEFSSSTTNGRAPKTMKKPRMTAKATHRPAPRSSGWALKPRPDTVV